MKHSDFKHIVKESLREAFYTNNGDYTFTGIVDKDGAVHAKKHTFKDPSWHATLFRGINGDRWRFDCGYDEIVWTNTPSEDSMLAVENFLFKNGEDPKYHCQWSNKLKTVGEKPTVNEGIDGHRLTVSYFGETLPAVLSKNTKPTEKPYRISVFSGVNPRGHIELTQQEAEELLQNNKLPDDVIKIYKNNLRIVNIAEGTLQEPLKDEINENLLLLENCSREIDLWLENRRFV